MNGYRINVCRLPYSNAVYKQLYFIIFLCSFTTTISHRQHIANHSSNVFYEDALK